MKDPQKDCCADLLLEVIPSVMCSLRSELKADGFGELTAQQFRILYLLNVSERSSSELAACTHSSRPAMTRLIDGLVKKGLVNRIEHPEDRRQVTISLSSKGSQAFRKTYEQAKLSFTETLKPLPKNKQATIFEALEILGTLFPSEPALL